jgi:hypothetical protein
MVEIHDKGIGLTPDDFADINRKLADPPTVDASVSQRMGLFVVGRLSLRHGIRVQLRLSGEQVGTTSLVMLPEAMTQGGGGEAMEETDFAVSRIAPEHRDGPYQGGDPGAAGPGLEERHYEVPDDARELDQVGRSLIREERRAALEAATEPRRQADGRPLFHDEAPEASAAPATPPSYQDLPYQQRGAQRDHPEHAGYQQYRAPREESYETPHSAETPHSPAYQAQPGTETPHSAETPHGSAYQAQYQRESTDYPGYPQYTGFVPHQPSYETSGGREWDDNPQAYQQEPGQADSSQPAPWTGSDPGPEVPGRPQERVGYDAPDAGPGKDNRLLTETGPPRREPRWQQPEPTVPDPATAASADAEGPQGPHEGISGGNQEGQENAALWRSANDEHWQRAEQARKPRAGGVTPSGLPRRVPRANLVPGAAHQTPQGSPQVSRAPEDVRGRLADLRRGIQQGRSAGSDATSTPTDSQGHGPNHQER